MPLLWSIENAGVRADPGAVAHRARRVEKRTLQLDIVRVKWLKRDWPSPTFESRPTVNGSSKRMPIDSSEESLVVFCHVAWIAIQIACI